MIQRIQTLYLAITFVLSLLLFFIPMAGFDLIGVTSSLGESVNTTYSYTAVGLNEQLLDTSLNVVSSNVYSYSFALIILLVIILLVNIIGIFLYKKRIFQMRFNLLNILLNLGLYPLFLLFEWSTIEKISMTLGVENISVNYFIPLTFPLINMILTYLAIRAIGKDEALVRSLDRIR